MNRSGNGSKGGNGGGGDYEVGYRKPPKHTRFPPGESGNSRGRPKGTKNLKTDLIEELREKIVVREGERSKRISKQRAVVKALVGRTLKGDARAAGTLTSLMMRLLDTGDAPTREEPLNEDELALVEAFKARLLRDAMATEGGRHPEAPEQEDLP